MNITSAKMQDNGKKRKWPDFRFTTEEVAGAVGDYGTLFPIILGVAVVTDVNLGHILLFFALWYILTGLYYKKPVPVEPMKAIGAIVIAGEFTQEIITASGILIGIFFLILGFMGGMKFIRDKIPQSLIRGVQLGLALILLETSYQFISHSHSDFYIAVIGIAVIVIFFVLKKYKNLPDMSSLIVLVLGFIIGISIYGIPSMEVLTLPSMVLPSFRDFLSGGWLLVIPQIPLTITNSILATSLLIGDLFKRKEDPDKLSKSVGLMNLTSPIFGGFPMCHGSGGLAAQYRYGARTGGSNIISGLILLVIAFFFAGVGFIELLPLGIFGALLVFVAMELGKHSFKTDSYLITGAVGIVSLLINISVGFVVGIVLYYLFRKIEL